MRVALASCDRLPEGAPDDAALRAALRARGGAVSTPDWRADVDWASFDLVVVRSTWDYQEHRDEFVGWADRVASVTRLTPGARTIRWNTHKAYLEELREAGALVVPTEPLPRGSAVDLREVCDQRGWECAVVKPMVGATSRETYRFTIDDVSEAQAAADRLAPSEDLMVQRFLPNVVSVGELSVMVIAGEPRHAVRKRPGAGDYRVQEEFGGAHTLEPLDESMREAATRVVELASGTLGETPAFARVDFLPDDDGSPLLNELELVEPQLFFDVAPESAERLADELVVRAAER